MTDNIEITDADRAIAEKARGTPGGYMAGYAYAAALARTGWTPAPEVDPDLLEAREIVAKRHKNKGRTRFAEATRRGAWDNEAPVQLCLKAIKRGRELAAPGWIQHDGSGACPTKAKWALARYGNGDFSADKAVHFYWSEVTHYLLITKPEGAA